ncbi:cobyric acid synthase [Pseudoalteromonas sp. G4]|uniref:cobyric acid synthase n=1 Tax=Pseudoalteromonas sp. G4 TaxID=2992761 RepID=UPI00237DB9D5|nr:cobyric acid synthase [Pseudoalteromonas sp. G4]MDE3270619.1 cobyric acid synthase [Pseudoalteromonas sp. G4]
MKAKQTLMVQGTTSDAGKSILVAALCRILSNHNVRVAPFKPQNMALNSAVTKDGGEIGRAQAVQAEAARVEASVDMNPVLLKPNSDIGAQVIVHGKSIGNSDAVDYHQMKPKLLSAVLESHHKLANLYDVVIVEGAGSPAEINLRDRDIANMGFAEAADCPVIIVADIDKGGVFAHLVGTYELLSESEKARIKGFVINKFRGDIALLKPGNDWLEQKLGIPVLATIPYIPNLYIEPEDALDFNQIVNADTVLHITVVVYPRISNHTDFDVLRLHPNVELSYARTPNEVKKCDLLILPGSKSVISDFKFLEQEKWQDYIAKLLRYGGKVFGICGGMQMLGQDIFDPNGIESTLLEQKGLGYLPIKTTLMPIKKLSKTNAKSLKTEVPVSGYEIHAGVSEATEHCERLFKLDNGEFEGYQSADNQIKATYLHGIFDNSQYLTEILTWVGLNDAQTFDYTRERDAQIEKLASEVEAVLSIETIKDLLSLPR